MTLVDTSLESAGSAALAPGARVVIRSEEWLVRSAPRASHGGHAVHVTGVSELVRGIDAIFLTELDRVIPLRPEETTLVTDPSPGYRRSRLFLESLLRRTPPTEPALYVGHRAALRPTDYQFQPAQKALGQLRPRLLVADGVGLGKTVEVGILLSELIQRGRGQRILVVALKSILAQFQRELWARFTIPLVRLDSVGIERVQRRIPASQNPFYSFDKVIISIDTLKRDAKYRRYLEASHWDVVVVDECQNVAVRAEGARKSQRARLAELLATTSDGLILTSATPHDGRAESFASLLNLLEPTAITDPTNLKRDEASDYVIRRFKKDVAHEVRDAFGTRESVLDRLDASPTENAVFDALTEVSFRTLKWTRTILSEGAEKLEGGGGALFETQLLKSFLSSPAACLATIGARRETLRRRRARSDREDVHEDVAHDEEQLALLEEKLCAVDRASFTKYQRLLERLRELGFADKRNEERLVLFSERIPTLDMLRAGLLEDVGLHPKQLAIFHGSLDDIEQRRLVESFGAQESPLRILLCSDVASEGVNLHHCCHRLWHFDLPWSLITLEQRNGRIDRFGQTKDPQIRYLLTTPENEKLQGDLRILERLIEKERQVHENLGDPGQLLGLYDASKEEEHIGRGIAQGLDPEQVLPDDDAAADWLDELFGGPQDEPEATRKEPLRLFDDDLEYTRAAIEELGPELAGRVEWLDELAGLELDPPEDLERRYDSLPPELREHGSLKLTTDRARVMRSLDEARQKEERIWPEWQLLWELHPFSRWLDDRVQSRLQRHEAPVIEVDSGISGEVTFVFQGIVSNHRGQPLVVEWFGVDDPARLEETAQAEVVPLGQLLTSTGLGDGVANPARPLEETKRSELEGALAQAVAVASEHVQARRLERAAQVQAPLQSALRRLRDWRDQQHAALNKRAQRSSAVRRRLDAERRRIDELRAERERWFNESMRTNPQPYLRLVAVFVSSEPMTRREGA